MEYRSSDESVVTVTVEQRKGYYYNSSNKEYVFRTLYTLILKSQECGTATATLSLYGYDASGNKVIYDTKNCEVTVQAETWYSQYIEEFPCKQHEWQYGDDITVSVWSKEASGYSKTVMIIDGSGEMWGWEKAGEKLGVSSPWKDPDYCDYVNSIREVHIAEGVTYIEDLPSRLEVVTFPSTLKTIGEYTFSYCDFTEIILPEGLETIGKYAFLDCMNVTKIELPSTLKYIGNSAFGLSDHPRQLNKSLLKEVVLPEGLEYVGYIPFGYRWGTNVIIPESLDATGFNEYWDWISWEYKE